jgi:antitoxin HicB
LIELGRERRHEGVIMMGAKDLNYYRSLPYTIEMTREDATTWFVRVVELPGCISEGDSPAEAIEMIHDAMAAWLEVALEDGREIPEPKPIDEYSGKFVVRVSRSLHRDLVEAAERDEVSLNQYIGTELARSVGHSQARRDSAAKVAVNVDPYWPGLHVGLRKVLAGSGYAAEAQAIDEQMCADWFGRQFAEIERDLGAGYVKDAIGKIDDLRARLYVAQPQSPMMAVMQNLLGLLHAQVELAAQYRNQIVDRSVRLQITEFTTERIAAAAERTLREETSQYNGWSETEQLLGGEPTSW